VEGEAPSEP